MTSSDPTPEKPALTPAEAHNRKTLLGLGGGFLALLLAIMMVGWFTDEGTDSVDPSNDVLLNRPYDTLDGQTVDLALLNGKPIVVNIFASWCTACITEMPEFEAAFQDLSPDVAFIGLNVDEPSLDDARQLVADTGVTYPIALGTSRESIRGVLGIPTTIFYNSDGTRCGTPFSGRLDADGITNALKDCT